jgi:dCTP deaminase
MILSSAELHKALDEGRLVIEPEPSPRVPTLEEPHCPFDTHSVDLRLAPEISIPRSGPFSYDLTQPGLAAFISANSDKHIIQPGHPFQLEKHKFILGKTLETVKLPILPKYKTCLAARIEGKSSRARCALLIHFTAPTVHPGWEGPLTLEIINLGPATILLSPGLPIAQLIVEEVKGLPAALNPSQFQGQSTPEGLPANDGHPSGSEPNVALPSHPAARGARRKQDGRKPPKRSARKRSGRR